MSYQGPEPDEIPRSMKETLLEHNLKLIHENQSLCNKITAMGRDSELLDLLEIKSKEGWCPSLLNDDSQHWAVVGDGMQNVPIDTPCDIQTTFWVEKHQWENSVREALEAFALEVLESEGNYDDEYEGN